MEVDAWDDHARVEWMPAKLALVLRLIGAGALGVTALTLRARACSLVFSELGPGVVAGFGPRDLPAIPRNAAFVWSRTDADAAIPAQPVVVALDPTSQPIMGRVLIAVGNKPRTFVAKPDEPLPPHFLIQSGGDESRTGDYVDERPPETPNVINSVVRYDDGEEGCGTSVSSCGDLTSLEVTLAAPANDDHVPVRRVPYLIYLEKTAEAARTTRTPFALVSELPTVNGTTLNVWLDRSWADSDAFVTVSAIDWAANESPRTEPLQANSGGGGCTLSLRHQHRPSTTASDFSVPDRSSERSYGHSN
jgi:hypothetical protein